ncbi:hypothetical protein [uncultured Shewanella sp.]|nr:hypothetical protein [uncultured Shewanella sp.]
MINSAGGQNSRRRLALNAGELDGERGAELLGESHKSSCYAPEYVIQGP